MPGAFALIVSIVPFGARLSSASAGPAPVEIYFIPVGGQELTCIRSEALAAGESSVIRVTSSVAVGVGEEVTNTAVVVADGPVDEQDITDNFDSASAAVAELPRTGADLMRIALIGLIMLLSGASLLRLSGRRL